LEKKEEFIFLVKYFIINYKHPNKDFTLIASVFSKKSMLKHGQNMYQRWKIVLKNAEILSKGDTLPSHGVKLT